MENDYYDIHTNEFIDSTFKCDMSIQYHFFLKHFDKKQTILDLGFGSGRDMIFFNQHGYKPIGYDPSIEMVKKAKTNQLDVYHGDALSMNFKHCLDGIWACSSLLHVKKEELSLVFKACSKALKPNGIMYASFKYGDFSGYRKERYFHDLTEESLKPYLLNSGLRLIDVLITNDVRPGRTEEKWLNVILERDSI